MNDDVFSLLKEVDGNCLGALHSKVLFLHVKRIWDFLSESFCHFSSESPLQT